MFSLDLTLLKKIVGVGSLIWGLIGSNLVLAQDSGKEIFQQNCAVCHKIGGGRLVGPDLAGVNDRHPEDWLLKFIKSSQTTVKSGDLAATKLFDEFKIVMPDQNLTDDRIKKILAYIKEAGVNPAASVPTAATTEATPEEIVRGQNLFQGKNRLSNGGPSCIACHTVINNAIIGGGILAKDLTMVYSRLGEPGIRAILTNPPFPVMKAAFDGKPISDEEIYSIIGFLKIADKENILHQPREYGWALFASGSLGVFLLLGFYSLVWRRRKRNSVNQEIYDRQIKSE